MATPLELLVTFAKVGAVGFGGGPSMIPLVQAEVVERRGWMSNAEFVDVLAAGNALPGPIATKMAVYIGYQTGGAVGAAAGLAGLLLPSTALMLLLAAFLTRHSDHPRVVGALQAVRPVVLAMLAWVVVQIAPASVGGWTSGALVVLALGLLYLEVHPAWLIAGAALLGGVFLAR
jgi:chromate transporter